MSAAESSPDVVVIGLKSCGKTVFFTVLDKKFGVMEDGSCASPLGFGMERCYDSMSNEIDKSFDMLMDGHWPAATREGQVIPLKWEVFTGERRILELSSMDLAGETVAKALGISSGKATDENAAASSSRRKRKTKAVNDSGEELFHGDARAEYRGDLATEHDRVAEELRKAIEGAKVVCFMVNIALPEYIWEVDGKKRVRIDREERQKLLDARVISEKDAMEIERRMLKIGDFRDIVDAIYFSLKGNKDLQKKSIIVLTQAHRYQDAIDLAGGACTYLGIPDRMRGASLSKLARERNIPVISVSAINELTGAYETELPEISSPENIPSDGLLGFLILVAGTAAPDDNISSVKDAYLSYLQARAAYQRSLTLTMPTRLLQSEGLATAAQAFSEACRQYVDDPKNLRKDSRTSVRRDILETWRRATKNSLELRKIADRTHLDRDRLWDGEFRKNVLMVQAEGEPSSDVVTIIEGGVVSGLRKYFPNGAEESQWFVYGVGTDRLKDRVAWVKENLLEYRRVFDREEKELKAAFETVERARLTLRDKIGIADFENRLMLLGKKIIELREMVDSFKAAWSGVDVRVLSEAQKLLNELPDMILDVKAKHRDALAEKERQRRDAAAKAEDERRKEEVSAGINGMRDRLEGIRKAVASLRERTGCESFPHQKSAVERQLSSSVDQFETSKKKWLVEYRISVPDMEEVGKAIDAIRDEIVQAAQEHAIKVIEDEKRRDALIAAKRRRRRLLLAVAFLGLAMLLCVASRVSCTHWNDRYAQIVKAHFERGYFSRAKEVYENMYELPALRISRNKHFAPGFAERLASAAELSKKKELMEKHILRLRELTSAPNFEEYKPSIADSVLDAVARAWQTYAACTSQLSLVTFDAVRLGSVNLDGLLTTTYQCESSLVRACDDLDSACQQVRVVREVKEFEELLSEVESKLSNGAAEEVVDLAQEAETKINNYKLPPRCDDSIKNRFSKVKAKVKELNAGLVVTRIGILLKNAESHYAAKRWEDCVAVAEKVLSLDVGNEKATALKNDSSEKIESKKAVDSAERSARDARIAAMVAEAESFATQKWSEAEAMKVSAANAFGAGDYKTSRDLYVNAQIAYERAEAQARENAKPRVYLTATLPEPSANPVKAKVVRGVALEHIGRTTPLTVNISSRIGSQLIFGVEYEADCIRYCGETRYTVEKGGRPVEIKLDYKDTIKWARRRCGHCGRSLENNPHVYKCPDCKGAIAADAFMD